MNRAPAPSSDADATRERILRAALEQFGARGYHATSLREIAEAVAISKAAVLYHFASKDAILAALAEPLLSALEGAVARAGTGSAAAWSVVEGVLDVWLEHRYLLQMNLQDLALAGTGAVFERFRAAMLRANALVAGPRPDLARKVRAAQAIAMLGDPVVLYADEPEDLLRESVLDGVRRLLGSARTGEPSARPTRRGRPSSVDARMADSARRMHAAGKSAEEIAEKLGVSRATVYRHIG